MSDRVIRDELLTSERYWSVSIEAQRLFVHLLLVVDNLGRFSGKNYTLRAACFPGQAVAPEKLEKMLTELHDADLVRIYQIENQRYIFVPRFRQHLRYTKHSLYPEPPKEINDIFLDSHGAHRERTVLAPKKRSEVKRSEEKRREEKSREARATRLPQDWSPSELIQVWAGKTRPDLDLAETIAKFRDYWASQPGSKGVKTNWEATFRNWVRNEKLGHRQQQVGEVI